MERDDARDLWNAVQELRGRVSALESSETARDAVARDRRHLLDSWLVRGMAFAMLILQAVAIYFAARR